MLSPVDSLSRGSPGGLALPPLRGESLGWDASGIVSVHVAYIRGSASPGMCAPRLP
jgi:hypothetical protein